MLSTERTTAYVLFRDSEPETYDAVLMDVRMPGMNGLEAAAAIRAMDRTDAQRIPIIALTANAFDEDVKRSLQAGMNAHLSKPVEPTGLYQVLGELIYEAENGDGSQHCDSIVTDGDVSCDCKAKDRN